ncbi:MAG: Eco57I restriction-modification methylase domain-containing protein, partial [Promethearchaeota archaeon]
QGGFDIVIGNPPYVRIHSLEKNKSDYFIKKFNVAKGQIDLYSLFIEKSINLLRDKGKFSFIIPRFIQFNLDSEPVRNLLLNYSIENLTEVGKAFDEVNTECLIFVLSKDDNNVINIYNYYPKQKLEKTKILNKNIFLTYPNKIFNTLLSKKDFEIIKKISEDTENLSEVAALRRGMEIGKKYIKGIRFGIKTLLGEDVSRYYINFQNTYCNKDHKEVKRLKEFSETEKLLIRRVSDNLIISYDNSNFYFLKNLYSLISDKYNLKYLLGIINSKTLNYYFKKYFTTKKEEIFPEIQIYQLNKFPIKIIDFNNNEEKTLYDRIVEMVDQMLEVQKKYHNAKTENEKTIYKKQTDILDNQIDRLVYRLYGLTEEEISIVEESN